MKYFDREDFDCPCCGENQMNGLFLRTIDNARSHAGTSFVVTSGYRCEKHNTEVGGKPLSAHRTGFGADIAVNSSSKRFRVIDGAIAAGFNRIGVAKTFIHMDCDPNLPKQVMWVY